MTILMFYTYGFASGVGRGWIGKWNDRKGRLLLVDRITFLYLIRVPFVNIEDVYYCHYVSTTVYR